MEAGFAIAEQWLNQGAIVQRRSRKGIETGHASARSVTDKPMVVLVNQGTSGAGEILIGALQDNGDALVVGQTTLGSGLIQTTRTLADDTAILVTIGDYLTPSGRSLRTARCCCCCSDTERAEFVNGGRLGHHEGQGVQGC